MAPSPIAYSVIVPIYLNEAFIGELMQVLSDLYDQLDRRMEAVFVVDASPDRSLELLREALPKQGFPSQLLLHSRNFGSFAAIRSGLAIGQGQYFAFMAADLQEPPDLLPKMFHPLDRDQCDLVIGVRESRNDPWRSKLASLVFWGFYRRLIQPNIPSGGVDVFACNKAVRDQLLQMQEANTSLIGQLFWIGYRREQVAYVRQPRKYGRSAWTFRKKAKYLGDSLFGFSDLPVRMLMTLGLTGMVATFLLALVVLIAKLSGSIPVPGYAATILTISFFAGLNSFGLGLIGAYVWRTFENTKHRPTSIVMSQQQFPAKDE